MGFQALAKYFQFFKNISCFIKINVCIFAAAFERLFFKNYGKKELKKYVKYFCGLRKVYYFCNPF